MIDYLLALTVLIALIVLGALISVGNERQRRAIDSISQQTQAWAIEDLRLKRGQVEANISIDNPIAWLNIAASRILGRQTQFSVPEITENPLVVSFVDQYTGETMAFSLLSPKTLRTLSREKRSELSKRTNQHPLIPWRKGITSFEMTILNAGIRFDLELPVAWQEIMKEETNSEHLWVYILP
ncbi:MAG: hypothetical protein ISR59_13295 [Anaerolineales bacterium]|uniref:Uncharacterized protein n=1 Tax=Candidatus Desulfolinea nitratireducens TaxID=2841698 RepID=A0A8J6NPM8_9CHLR|nr:hypothetical protein [Candidatus Desulfolinea nitratireducens]MBL6962076.1 hypothetical protein [Anaerolineales bacterium]